MKKNIKTFSRTRQVLNI